MIVRVSSIDESISGIRMFELYSAEMFSADARLSESSIANKNDSFIE